MRFTSYLLVLTLCGIVTCGCSGDGVGGPECLKDADCSGDRICRDGACRQTCQDESDCSAGQLCIDGACRDGCRTDADCPAEQVCLAGICGPGECLDADGDGYGPGCQAGPDCDDGDRDVHPGAQELCDGKDNDCNGLADSGIDCAGTCCDVGQACRYETCLPDLGLCATDGDCQEDAYCDQGACLPYGHGPRGEKNPECTRLIVAGLFQPALQCEWSAPAGDAWPNHLQVLGTPMVADFDFDGDRETVRPSIVFATYDGLDGDSGVLTDLDGVLRIVDGASCQTLFSLGPYLNGCNPVAIGDLDGAPDGRPEIVAHTNLGAVIAFKYDPAAGAWTTLWTGHDAGGAALTFGEGATGWGGPSLVDLDDDGSPEVLSGGLIYDATGLLLDGGLGLDALYRIGFPVAADLDGDQRVELTGGSAVWEYQPAAGAWVAERSGGEAGFTAVADFGTYGADPAADDRSTLDGLSEVAVVANGFARIDDLAGRTVFGPVALPASSGGGPPTIGDFDRDGRAELAAAGSDSLTIFDPDCRQPPDAQTCPTLRSDGILWSRPSQDHSSNITGSSLFDFEGDGAVEAVYADECFVRVYSGADGTVLYSQWRSSCTWNENPIVADVDGDFSAELVVPSNQSCEVVPENLGATAYETSPHGHPMDPLFAGLPCQDATDCVSGSCDEGLCRCGSDAECPAGGGFVCAPPPAGTPGAGQTCRAEWLGSISGVRVYRDALDRWVGSRTIWNQHAYAVTNVLEDGRVPRTSEAQPNWSVPGLNNFRQNIQGDLNPESSPDLTAGLGNAAECDPDGNLDLQVRVCNRGTYPIAQGADVAFYAGDPDTGGEWICTAQTTLDLHPGECEVIGCTWTQAPEDEPTDVYVVADPDGARSECLESNNRAVIRGVVCQANPT